MKELTIRLRAEHEIILAQLMRLAHALDDLDREAIDDAIEFFRVKLPRHRRKEEEVLFPALAAHLDGGLASSLAAEHRAVQAKIAAFCAMVARDEDGLEVAEAGWRILVTLVENIFKEDHVVFPVIDEALTNAEKRAVVAGMDAIGYLSESDRPVPSWSSRSRAAAAGDGGNGR